MEESGKQNSNADMRNVIKNCMESGVIPKQEVLVGDQLSSADEELIIHYLDKKMIDQRFPNHAIHEVDFFLYHPQQLSEMHCPSQAEEWYFLSPASEKYTVGQSNSTHIDGYWEPCGADSLIHKDGKLIGYRKTLNYIEGKHEEGKMTDWVLHEYRLERSRDVRTGTTSEDMKKWIFCKLFKLNDKFIAAEEKEATKFAGPNDGASSTGQTILGLEKANSIINDKRPTSDLLPLPDTDQGTGAPHSSSELLDQAGEIWSFDKPLTYPQSQHDQGTILPTLTPHHGQTTTPTPSAGRGKATKKVVNNKRPSNRCKRGSHTLPESDPGSMMPHFVNANSVPQRDQGTLIPLPLPQNDQRAVFPASTGPHKSYSGVVIDKSQSNSLSCGSHPLVASGEGLMLPRCFDKIPDLPTGIQSSDGTIASSRHQHGALLPSHLQRGQQTILPRPQHDQQSALPPLTGIHNATNDGVSVKRPTLDHHHNALNLSPPVQVPKLPPIHGSAHGSHDNEAAEPEAPWPIPNPERDLDPYCEPFGPLMDEDLAYFDQPDPGYPQAYE